MWATSAGCSCCSLCCSSVRDFAGEPAFPTGHAWACLLVDQFFNQLVALQRALHLMQAVLPGFSCGFGR